MNHKWDYELTGDQLSNPVIYSEANIQGITANFDEEAVLQVLTNKGHQLKTWGGGNSTSEAHWIGVKKSTPLHTDPHYPRYTHHLMFHVDKFGLRGMDKESIELKNNQYLVIDTHSPHQLHSLERGATYYIAASIDSHEILDKDLVIPKLIDFINNNPLNANIERIKK